MIKSARNLININDTTLQVPTVIEFKICHLLNFIKIQHVFILCMFKKLQTN